MEAILIGGDLLESYLIEDQINNDEFKEYKENLDRLDLFVDPELFFEARVDGIDGTRGEKIKDAIKNTKEGTGKLIKAYDDVTDGGGSLIKGVADFVFGCIGLIAKVTKFIFTNLAKIPRALSTLVTGVAQIPSDVRDKIRGNIKLWITAQDIGGFYNDIMPNIQSFMTYVKKASEGDTWKKEFSLWGDNDFKTIDEMEKVYQKIQKVTFNQTTIEMRDQKTVELYFGGKLSIEDHFVHKKTHQLTYHQGLMQLMTDLGTLIPPLQEAQEGLSGKHDKTKLNQELAKLNHKKQARVRTAIMMVSKVVSIIGNLMKYVMEDKATMEKELEKIKAATGNHKAKAST